MASFSSFRSGSARPSRPALAGLDLGGRTMKLVLLDPAEEPRVAALREAPTPRQVFPEGQGFDSRSAARALEELTAGLPIVRAPVAVSLPPAAVRVRRMALAPMDGEATRRALAMDPSLRVPGAAPETLFHAFHELDTPDGGSGSSRPLLAAAARQDAIRAHQRALAEAGLTPGRIGVGVVALAALHRALHPEETEPGARVLLVHGGHSRTEIVVLDGGVPVVSHQLLIGGETMIERARRAGAEGGMEAAEEMLRGGTAEARAIHAEIATRLQQDLRLTLGAAAREAGGEAEPAALRAVRFSGGMAGFPALLEELADRIGTPVETLDPARRFELPMVGGRPPFGPAYAMALGAALEAHVAAGGRGGVGIDLALPLDPNVRQAGAAGERLRALAADRGVLVTAAVTLLLTLGVPTLLGSRLEAKEAAQEERQAAAAAASAKLAEVRRTTAALQTEQRRLEGALGSLDRLELRRDRWTRLMDGAAVRLPEHTWLEALEMDPPAGEESSVRIYGIAPSLDHVNRYERALGQGGLLARISLVSSGEVVIAGIPMVRFVLSGTACCSGEDGGYTAVERPLSDTPAAGAAL